MINLISLFNRNRPKIISIITLILILINIVNLYFILNILPTSNDECIWMQVVDDKGNVQLRFENVKYNGVTWQAGIEDGDILVKINDYNLSSDRQAQDILNKVEEGDFAKYTVLRNGELFETKVFIKKLIPYQTLGVNLLAWFWVLIAFLVLKSKPFGELQIAFYKIGIMLTFVGLRDFFTLRIFQETFSLNFLLAIVFVYGVVFLPFKVIEFFLIFPKQFSSYDKKYVKNTLKYLPRIIYLTIFLLFIIQFTFDIKPNFTNYLIFAFYNSIIFAFLLALILLYISYFKLKERIEKKKIFFILVGFTIGILIIFYINIISQVNIAARINNPEYFVPIILLSLTPISFAYSIFRYSLLDISDVIKNTLTYGLATISIAILYFFSIYFLGQSISSVFVTDYQGLLAGGLFVIFALIFQSTKDKFQHSLTKRFYPDQYEYQNELINFSNEIVSFVGIDNILNKIFFTFTESLKIEKVALIIKDKKNQKFKLVKQNEVSVINTIIDLNEEKLKELLSNKRNNKLLQILDKNEFISILKDENYSLESFYTIVPMIIQNRIIGLLLLGLKPNGTQFTYKEMELLVAFANQASISIENSLLYEAESENLKIQRDLDNARKIQMSLVPSNLPNIKGMDISAIMIPAEQIGGDYYDIIKINENSFYAIVGDVSGKGLPAAFYMTKLQTLVRLFTKKNLSPKEILIKINQNIFENIEKNSFITISIAHFDLERKVLTFCRAGHTQLLISNNKKVKLFKPQGMGVGLSNNEIFSKLEEIEIELEHNDRILIFSDGVTEEMNKNNEMFGIEQLSNIINNSQDLKSNKVIDEIIENLKLFRSERLQNDDITMIAIKVIH